MTPGSWNCYIIVYSSSTTSVTPVTFKDLFHYPIPVAGHKHSSQAKQMQPGRTKMQEKAKKKSIFVAFFFFSKGKEAVVISWNLAAVLFLPLRHFPSNSLLRAENTRPALIFRDFNFHPQCTKTAKFSLKKS